ncbi:MAG TPA: hypothetical protein VMU77_07995 [Acidimicrobiales bacterium]|nr:hypothetical protein [Acidimicrobiales bacterium]
MADCVVSSHTEAVRLALEALIDVHRRAQVGGQIVEAYRHKPQTSEEVGRLGASTAAMIAAEPW